MVVEDEPIIALHFQALLEDLGFSDIRLAFDLRGASALLHERAPDLAILDVNVGRELIYPLAAEMRRQSVRFAFATGRLHSEILPEWSGVPVIPKPLTKHSLDMAIRSLGFAPEQLSLAQDAWPEQRQANDSAPAMAGMARLQARSS